MLTHLRVTGLLEPKAPHIVHENLIISYAPQGATHHVGVAFEHEDYRVVHNLMANENDIFFLVYPVPEEVRELSYRLIVNGLWIPDPVNPMREIDHTGLVSSKYAIPAQAFQASTYPSNTPTGVTFRYQGNPGERVFVSGTFNNWNPFMYPMAEIRDEPGVFRISLPIPVGEIYYHFIINGRATRDIGNPRTVINESGREVSVFAIN